MIVPRLALGFGLCLIISLASIPGSAALDDSPPAPTCKGDGDSSSDCDDDDNEHEPKFTPGTLRIPRERNLSLQDYYERYEDAQTPVIIEDYGHAFAGMSRENIQTVCGNVPATVARRVKAEEATWASIDWYDAGTLSDAMDSILVEKEEEESDEKGGSTTTSERSSSFEPTVEGSIVGVFDWPLNRNCETLLERHFVVPKYLAQDYLQRIPRTVDLHYRDSWPSLFVGVDGTYGGAHRDVFGSAFWMYVVEGAKEWHIVDSADESTDFFGTGKRPRVRHYNDIVRQGSLLIIPGNRWHQVRNVGNTVTLAGNFVSRGSFPTMREVVEKNPTVPKGRYYKQLENTLLRPGFDASIDYDQGDMTWKEYKSGQSRPLFGPETEATIEGERQDAAGVVAVLVGGAGSSEVNGCYLLNGMNAGAFQFELDNDGGGGDSGGRSFELFKVSPDLGWWNILERIGGSYPNPVHYGSLNDDDGSVKFPHDYGWGSTEHKDHWVGKAPMPSVELMDRDSCVRRGNRKR